MDEPLTNEQKVACLETLSADRLRALLDAVIAGLAGTGSA